MTFDELFPLVPSSAYERQGLRLCLSSLGRRRRTKTRQSLAGLRSQAEPGNEPMTS